MTSEKEKMDFVSKPKPSAQFRAVLTIIQSDLELERLVMPHIEVATENIDWQKVCSIPFAQTQKAAINWCFHLWADRIKPRIESSDVTNFDRNLKRAVLEAVGIRWGLVD